MHAHRSRSCDASCVDRLIVGAVVGSQNEPARASKGDPGKAPRAVKIESKSIPDLVGTPYGILKAPRSCPKSVSGASWGVPSTPQQHQEGPQGRPGALKGAPWSVWERAEATKIEAETHTGWKTVSFWHAARSRSVVQAKFYRVFSILHVFAEPANPLKYCACQQKRRFGPVRSESSRLRHGTSQNYEKH